jgi:hypothetical protein
MNVEISADQICQIRVAARLITQAREKKNTVNVDEILITSLSQSFPPK